MNDEQLQRTLQSVGQQCFVKYYGRMDVETLRRETDYTENSCVTRTNHARRIMLAGRGPDALALVISSDSPRVSQETRQAAQELMP